MAVRGRLSPARSAVLVAAVAAAGMLGACAPATEQVEYREVVLELLRAPERLTVLHEAAVREVSVETIRPTASIATGAGSRPALVLPPNSQVVFDIPDLGPDTVAHLGFGVSFEDHERHRGTVVIIGTFNDERVLRQELEIGGPKADRPGWIDHEIDVTGGGELVLRCRSELRGLRTAVAGLTLEQTRRVDLAKSSPDSPNLVLVVVDTLRSDRLSSYGHDRPTSPRMDDLAARGVLWEDSWSVAPWTWPSTASILTGLEPPTHGVLDRYSCYLPDSTVTLAEHARAAGFATFGYSSNPLISVGQNFGQGFDRFETEDWTRSASLIEPALEDLGRIGERRFLLYLHLTDPHMPFEPEPDLREEFVTVPGPADFGLEDFNEVLHGPDPAHPLRPDALAYIGHLYDSEVAAADRAIGRVLDRLAQLGLDDRTLVAITSDHGEELLEHGRLGHSHQLYRESVIVPLIAAGPGLPSGERVSTPVQNHRLLPSLLDWLDLPPDPQLPPPLPFEDDAPRLSMYFGTEVGDWFGERASERLLARREGDDLVLWMPEGDRLAVFDTDADPGEFEDIAATRAELATRARDDLNDWWLRGSALRPVSIAGGEDTADMLRALGYLEQDE